MDLLFFELAVVIITASVVALFAHKLRQPLIIAYMITGLIVGPSLFDLLQSPEAFGSFAEIGIAFLLFLVGLNLDWRHIKNVGKIAILAGVGQIVFTTAFGYLIALALGFEQLTALFLGLAFALSSTIVIIKMLSDKEDIERFYGRITIGILIVQDIAAMLILLVINSVANGGNLENIISLTLLNGLLALIILVVTARYVLPHLFRYAAHSQELLFLTAIAWCFTIASALHLLGFGIEIGALFAGVTLAGTGFQREIGKKIIPLRDFFLIIFFIILGTNITLDALTVSWLPMLIFSLFVLIGNPIIVLIILRAFNYHPRTGFLVGVSLAQVSEFSFIILAEAAFAGLISEEILPMATLVGLVTIGISSYFIAYNEVLYEKMIFLFKWLEQNTDPEHIRRNKITPIIIFGYNRVGEPVLEAVKALKTDYLVVDFDPQTTEFLTSKEVPNVYGDAGNEDVLKYLRADKARLLISTIPDDNVNADILSFLKHRHSKASIIVTAKTPESAAALYGAGATFVIIPNVLGGKMFAQLLKRTKTNKRSWHALAKRQD